MVPLLIVQLKSSIVRLGLVLLVTLVLFTYIAPLVVPIQVRSKDLPCMVAPHMLLKLGAHFIAPHRPVKHTLAP